MESFWESVLVVDLLSLSSNSSFVPACENLDLWNNVFPLPDGRMVNFASKGSGETLEEERFSFRIPACSLSRLLQYLWLASAPFWGQLPWHEARYTGTSTQHLLPIPAQLTCFHSTVSPVRWFSVSSFLQHPRGQFSSLEDEFLASSTSMAP